MAQLLSAGGGWGAGIALQALREEEDLLEHHHSKAGRAKEKGRWLQETLRESMTSMNEELGDEPWSPLATFDIKNFLDRCAPLDPFVYACRRQLGEFWGCTQTNERLPAFPIWQSPPCTQRDAGCCFTIEP